MSQKLQCMEPLPMANEPKTFYFAGQWSFGNRGCEALIRSNTQLIRERVPTARLLCPSRDIGADRAQWPTAGEHGVEFVSPPRVPALLKAWNKASNLAPDIRRFGIPPLPLDRETRGHIAQSDAVLMTGGDIVSLDYGLLSLHYWTGVIDAARRLGKPTHLLAASVGPFTRDPFTERQMVTHLRGYSSITVRETASFAYLQSLGIQEVGLVADPAFVMAPEPWGDPDLFKPARGRLGLNVSPIVRGFRDSDLSREEFDREIKVFIRSVIDDRAVPYDVILIPHVDPLSGIDTNSDRAYMGRILTELGDTSGRVRLLPDGLNAAQLKAVLGTCRFFIGARTHATIGAISQMVPTLSIAYSVKAIGINRDLFGTTDYVLPTPDVSAVTLLAGLALLEKDEVSIKSLLAERLPKWRQNARLIPNAFVGQ